MQKISGILPGSSRVTSVDLKSSRPVRPGVPGFGAPEGDSSLRDQVTRSSISMVDPNSIEVPRWRSKEDANSEIVQTITDQFFRKKVDQPDFRNNSNSEAQEVPVYSGVDMMDFADPNEARESQSNSTQRVATYYKPEESRNTREVVLDTVA